MTSPEFQNHPNFYSPELEEELCIEGRRDLDELYGTTASKYSLQVISVGQEHVCALGFIVSQRVSELEQKLEACKSMESRKAIRQELIEASTLHRMILGAKSIDFHHHVAPSI